MKTLSPREFARILMTTSFSDGVTRTMRPDANGAISVNISDLTAQEKALARGALAEIATLTGLRFAETTGGAQITYTNDGTGANTQASASGSTITRANVRISSERVDPGDGIGSYAFRTYIHETLHALGLGHPQDYGRVRDFSQSAYSNDSWQMSIMSYFDQIENTAVDATKAYNLTPMLADYMALREMYGAAAVRGGNSVYGDGSNVGGALDRLSSLGASATALIADTGGIDHLNLASATAAQRIDLAPGAISNVLGGIGNLVIAHDTVIEHATGGAGADVILGNGTANRLAGGAGGDRIEGRDGADVLDGGAGNDTLAAGAGDDRLFGGLGDDRLTGGDGNDTITDLAGGNVIDAGLGRDTVTGGSGKDTILGGGGADSVSAGANNDSVSGGDWGDTLNGQGGNDTLRGDLGDDLLVGGDGNDVLFGGAGNDRLFADAGIDYLNGGAGNDVLRGGVGRDHFAFNDGSDTITAFDRATDVIDIRSYAGLDTWQQVRAALSQSGNDTVFRYAGDTLTIVGVQVSSLVADDFLF